MENETNEIINNSKEGINLRTNVILSTNRALLGSVTKHLRGVTVDYNKDEFVLRAYFDKGATTNDKESIDAALTEIEIDLYKEIKKFRYEPVDLFYPNKMTVLKDWVFLRQEDVTEQK